MPLIHLPDPVAVRVSEVSGGRVLFQIRDAAHADALAALLTKAQREGYAVEIKLLHYEGHPSMLGQSAARRALKERKR